MSTITFDTLKLARKLEQSCFTSEQASVTAEALSEVMADQVITQSDLRNELAPIKAELLVVKWMLGAVFAGVASLVIKSFF
jgi:hypothetical protein